MKSLILFYSTNITKRRVFGNTFVTKLANFFFGITFGICRNNFLTLTKWQIRRQFNHCGKVSTVWTIYFSFFTLIKNFWGSSSLYLPHTRCTPYFFTNLTWKKLITPILSWKFFIVSISSTNYTVILRGNPFFFTFPHLNII